MRQLCMVENHTRRSQMRLHKLSIAQLCGEILFRRLEGRAMTSGQLGLGFGSDLLERFRELIDELGQHDVATMIDILNDVRLDLHRISPFKDEPVDCVQWVESELVESNDYNPNSVAPPEMKLLQHSIEQDGYTQPIVAWQKEGAYEVIDGFHRNRVGRESKRIAKRVFGRLPITVINSEREELTDRMASTIRHNRARGKHRVEAMSDIVVELKRRNWSEDKIGRELGMDPDEVLRLFQTSGLTEMFADHEFSKSWDIGEFDDDDLDGSLDGGDE